MSSRTLPPPTDRIRFRRYSPADIDLVAELFADDDAKRFYPTMGTIDAHSRWITWNLCNYEDHGFGLWVIEHVESGEALGDCGLTMQVVGAEVVPEVGYHVLPSYRRQGIATESATACVRFAIGDLGMDSVCSIVHPDNRASISVATRIHTTRSSFVNARGEPMLLFSTHTDRTDHSHHSIR